MRHYVKKTTLFGDFRLLKGFFLTLEALGIALKPPSMTFAARLSSIQKHPWHLFIFFKLAILDRRIEISTTN